MAWCYSMLFIGRFLSGISGASFATYTAYLTDISDEKNVHVILGLLGVASSLGFILGSFIGVFFRSV
ncbi:MFS transporter [Bartonella sp. MM73XJBT.G]|uniref:MFS transporter n=1 Tax=Bartonella sp. MM73XJBT.G TaxID=3019097 RepID=UPI00385738AF